MKNIYILIVLLTGSLGLWAQPCTYQITPAVIDAYTSPVTIIFDATGTPMAGETEVYLWSWAEGGGNMDICGPDWGGIYPSAKLQAVEGQPNKFKLELPYTTEIKGETVTFSNFADLFSSSIAPGKLLRVGFMLRSLDGNKQTAGDMACELRLSPLNFEDKEFRTFPSAVSLKDVVTVYLNPQLSSNNQVKLMQDVKVSIGFLDEQGTVMGQTDDVEVNRDERGAWKYTFLPGSIILPEGRKLADIVKFKTTFKGKLNNSQGGSTAVETSYEQDFKNYR